MARGPEGSQPQPEKKKERSVLSGLLGGMALLVAGVVLAESASSFFSHKKAN